MKEIFIIKSIFSNILLKNVNIVFSTNLNNYFFINYIYIQFNFKSILFKNLAKLHAYSKFKFLVQNSKNSKKIFNYIFLFVYSDA